LRFYSMARALGRRVRPLERRKELFGKVLNLRAGGLSYNEIIGRVGESEGIVLSKSQVSDWLNGVHRPDGSVRRFEPIPSFELGYVTGVALGDGTTSVSSDHNYAIKLQVNDREFAEEFARCLGVVLGRPPPNVRWWEARHAWRTQVSSLLLLKFLRQPVEALQETIERTRESKIGFLRGFFDSEGWSDQGYAYMCNGEYSKLALVNTLLQSLGMYPAGPYLNRKAGGQVTIRGMSYRINKNQYRIRLPRDSSAVFRGIVGTSLHRKADRW